MRNLIKHKISLCFLSLAFLVFNTMLAQEPEVVKLKISGIVVDQNGKAVNDANISVNDEFSQSRTEVDGTFALEYVNSKVLIVNKEGFIPQFYTIEDEKDISIILIPEDGEKIIEVGYGYRTKTELTHAISSMSAQDLESTPVPNLEKLIPGHLNGLTTLKTSGDIPGYANSSFYVRGIGTFGGGRAPLVLVDNIERNFTELDPEEIASITVLKDAAATVLYGMDAANGVINVTTKRGSIGKPVIKLMAQGGFQQPTRTPEYLGAADYLTAYQKAYQNDYGVARVGEKYNPDNYDGTQDPYLYPDVDWYNEFIKKYSTQQQYKLSIAGGTNTARFYILGGFMQQNGILNHTEENSQYSTNIDYKRYNIRTNLDVDVTKNLCVSLDFSARIENRWMPNSSDGDIFGTMSSMPAMAIPMLNKDNSIAGTSQYRDNPLALISKTGYRDHYSRYLQANVRANYDLSDFIKGLSAHMIFGYDANTNYNVGRSQKYAVYEYAPSSDSYIKYGEESDIDTYMQNFGAQMNYRSSLITGLSYNRTFGVHKFGSDLRYQQYKYDQQANYVASASQGAFSRITYGYDKRYIAELGMSYSGSENFAKGNRFTFFPAVSGAWVISNESFLDTNEEIDFLKLRASYGLVGNSNLGIDRFTYQQQYSKGWGYTFGETPASSEGAYEGRLGNPNLTCEKSLNFNLGIDFEAYKTLSISADWFRNDRNGIITTQSNTFSSIIGQDLPYENLGSVLNTGLETTVGLHQSVGDFSYSAKANISYAKNIITDAAESSSLEEYQKQVGKSVGGYWGAKHLGFFENQAEIDNSPTQQFIGQMQPGDVKYEDKNKDSFVNDEDAQYLGNNIPNWNYGLVLRAAYKGFDINAVFYGVSGRKVILHNNTVWGLMGDGNATAAVNQAWGETENPLYPRLTTLVNSNNYRSSSLWIVNGDFLKLSNLELGYTIPSHITHKVKLANVRVFVNGNNLLSFDNLKAYDVNPEVPNAGVTGYPDMRVYNIGVSVKFN